MRFTLCSADASVMAVMPKGMSMKQCVTWYANDGTRIVWRRAGKVAFSLVESTPNTSRRNSIVSTCSGISSLGTTVGSVNMSADVYRDTEKVVNSSLSSAESGTSSPSVSFSHEEKNFAWHDLLNIFQSHFRKYPSLLQRFLHWGISRVPNCRVGEAEVRKFGKGRVWVSASLMQCEKGKSRKCSDVLDEIKGAYHETSPGVYLQT